MSEHQLPQVSLTSEEMIYLQDHLNDQRSKWFNYYELCLEENRQEAANRAHKHYEMFKSLRDKVYHMSGRDTLALGNHDQRWWDQQHDFDR